MVLTQTVTVLTDFTSWQRSHGCFILLLIVSLWEVGYWELNSLVRPGPVFKIQAKEGCNSELHLKDPFKGDGPSQLVFAYSAKKFRLWRIQPLNWATVSVSSVLPILHVACILYSSFQPNSFLSSLSSDFLCSLFLSLFSSEFSQLCPQSPLSSHHHLVSLFFFWFSLHLNYPLPATAHTLDVQNNSLDFSAHNLTVNRKWLTWISNLLYEHRARAAFVCTITLLKAFTLTNCLRSKKGKRRRKSN